jgi:polyribonucleotide nucleotidyltransferase
LDVKIDGLRDEEIVEIFARARTARMQILKIMLAAIPESRSQVSEYAPKIEQIHIPVDKIGEVIGPGGKNIKLIIAQTGADVDIDDDGMVSISGVAEDAVKKAVDWISGMTREVTPGEEFEGEVKRILPFGAFVEYLPGREGMVHVSKMRRGFVKDPSEVVAIGDKVKVKVEERDSQGRINLTMLLDDDNNDQPHQPRDDQGQPEGGYGEGGESQQRFDRPQGGYNRDSRGSSRPPFERRNSRPGFSRGNDRGGYSRSNDRPSFDRSGPSDRSAHPLSQQLRRENEEKRSGPRKFGPRKKFSR